MAAQPKIVEMAVRRDRLNELVAKREKLEKALQDVTNAIRDEIDAMRRSAAGYVPFSGREEQVYRLVLQGKGNKEIGWELHIAERTVKFHVSNILRKTHARSRIDLVVRQ